MSEQPSPGEVLETGKRLSDSATWRLQREFFDRSGARAWSEGRVPFHVTSNAYIAEAYLWVALRFLQDCARAPADSPLALDPTRPVYVVELGAGHGYFGYLFLCKLLEARARLPFALPPICYVLTDFTESNLAAWRKHERLRPFFAAGMLDVARFDVERDRTLRLENSGVELRPGSAVNPMVFVANYVFDSLSHDVFRIQRGQLEEGLATLRVARPSAERRDDRDILEHVDVSYDYQPVADATTYYPEEPLASRVLADYARRLGDTAFAFPLGAVRCMHHIADLAGGRLLMLTADKGYARELDLVGLGDPSMAHHRGGISMMVNYHALGELVAQRGGVMLNQVARAAALEICALVLGAGQGLPETRLAFDQLMERVGPTDVYRLLEQMAFDKMDLDQLLSVLRMAAWDPITFISLSRDLHRCAGDAYLEQAARLRDALQQVWALHFPLADGKDVAFELGFVYYAMRRYREAMAFYERSIALYGDHQVTLFNMGLCQFQQGKLDDALALFDRALVQAPTYAPARDWRMRVQSERAQRAALGDESPAIAGEPIHAGLGPGLGLGLRPAEPGGAAAVVVRVADGQERLDAPGLA